MQKKMIFLIGFMGVGKTTLGKKLANALQFQFVDIDEEIEKKYGMTVAAFFEHLGEEKFRMEETQVLKDVISQNTNAVVSVGGGLPCFNDNMSLMNDVGVTCYLFRPAKELYNRLKHARKKRPLIDGLNDVELLDFIETKLNERSLFYEQAKVIAGRDKLNVTDLKVLLDVF